MENQENNTNAETENILTTDPITKDNIDALIEDLKFFMETFDPYGKISEQDKSYLSSIHIYDIEDPFRVTNQLISRIEDLIEKKQQLLI